MCLDDHNTSLDKSSTDPGRILQELHLTPCCACMCGVSEEGSQLSSCEMADTDPTPSPLSEHDGCKGHS